MELSRPKVGLVSEKWVRQEFVFEQDVSRLAEFADFSWDEFTQESNWDCSPPYDPVIEARRIEFARDLDALLVCHGAPRVTEAVLSACRRLTFVGELEGDRFARRVDVEAAASRGVKVVDTNQGSSYPVAEWALAMMLIGLRKAGLHFRRIISEHAALNPSGDPDYWDRQPGGNELTGRHVGLIGCGHIGRRLLRYLVPFECEISVYDPYIPREFADVFDFTLTSLERIMADSDVVVCLAPITPSTRGMLGRQEMGLLKSGSVFVNVSRGAIVQTDALIERLSIGDVTASLDVFDPEPIPLDSPIRRMDNVFLSPHNAAFVDSAQGRYFNLMVCELERFFSGHETRYDLTDRSMANRSGSPPPPR